ncbi:hypothetical protein [Novipirellula artificiosorum]|uniref:Vitamin K-dependent gamma-carboxylase n=1 Tax=Novipirellula artificiosorum TaxID=2528016 RepID=A0A5C6E2E1_9BACT|nr:hypothetical protein [Novipirellula artificiosorum]TWU42895.1 hypothetical protein Poly41_11960 [Novipirellula artificiosorum]
MISAETRESSGWLPRLWALMLLVLIGGTFPLWRGEPSALVVPMVRLPASMPHVVLWLPTLAIVLSCLAIVIGTRFDRQGWWIVAVSLCLSFVLNQHRLQPWAYQSAIYATVFATRNPYAARRLLIPIAASIYLYSGLGKLDYQFAHTVGQDFLAAIWIPGLGSLTDRLDRSTLAAIALLLPACEALFGIGLLIPQTRRVAGCFIILMHISLIAILGPWNLGHSLGVLFWNMLLILQAYFLFLRPIEQPTEPEPPRSVAFWVPNVLVVIAMIMPIGERFGIWDHWPSWALYAPHNSRVEVMVHQSATEKLAADLRPFLRDSDGDGWNRVDLGSWSLAKQRVPIYPQMRFQLAVADQLASQCERESAIRAVLRGVSDRRRGNRKEQILFGHAEIKAALRRFWLAHAT